MLILPGGMAKRTAGGLISPPQAVGPAAGAAPRQRLPQDFDFFGLLSEFDAVFAFGLGPVEGLVGLADQLSTGLLRLVLPQA